MLYKIPVALNKKSAQKQKASKRRLLAGRCFDKRLFGTNEKIKIKPMQPRAYSRGCFFIGVMYTIKLV